MSNCFHRRCLNIAIGFLTAMGDERVTGSESPPLSEDHRGRPATTSRMVHRFDFDERSRGNVEDVPMHWMPVRTDGFPVFTGGRFDRDVGHPEGPSFYLATEGRSVAYVYSGPDTPLRARCDYQVQGFIRPDRLSHARACVSAHYLAADGRPLFETLVRSRYVGEPADENQWNSVEFMLPSPPRGAAAIAVAVWVLEERLWKEQASWPNFVARRDLHGGAWFDDLTIRVVPRVELTTSQPGNVLSPDAVQELRVRLVDAESPTLSAQLTVRNAAGATVLERPLQAAPFSTPESSINMGLGDLPAGLYVATLDVAAEGRPVASKALTFARVEPGEPSRISGFGISLLADRRADARIEGRLIRVLGIGSVKTAIWAGATGGNDPDGYLRHRDREFGELAATGVSITAVLAGVPDGLKESTGASNLSVGKLLSEPPATLRAYLGDAAGSAPEMFRYWQIGPDIGSEEELGTIDPTVHDEFRGELQRLVTAPTLIHPIPFGSRVSDSTRRDDAISVILGRVLRSDEFPKALRRFQDQRSSRVAAFLEPLPTDTFQRDARLADFAQRLALARHAGAHPVVIPQPWTVRGTIEEPIVEPTEEFLILRTLAHYLHDSQPGPELPVAPGVRCLPFYNADTATVVIWNAQAPPEGRIHVTQLGRARRQIDLFGRSTPLTRDEQGQHVFHLSARPVIIDDVDRWLLEFRNRVKLEPTHVESGTEEMNHAIILGHTGAFPLGGQLALEAPNGWVLSPSQFRFTLVTEQETRLNFAVRYPSGEPAGRKQITARFSVLNDIYDLQVPLSVDIGLADVEVSGFALREGNELVMRHAVTNRSGAALSFRSSAQVPGRERQYRPLSNLPPNDTQVVEYRFPSAADLSGLAVRLGLRPLSDGRRVHNLELRAP